MAKVVGTWEGGRVIQKSNGKSVYYIRKRIQGRLYEVSTGATSLRAALQHLTRFQANPDAYKPGGELPGAALTVSGTFERYLEWCAKPRSEGGNGNSQNWVTQKRRYLKWWSEKLTNDLRRLGRQDVISAMKGETVPHNRLASLKALCSWLRDKEGLLNKSEDVTLDIEIEAPKPAQWKGPPRAITKETFQKTVAKIPHIQYADILHLMANTGIHITEAVRLSNGEGSIEDNILTINHKNGRKHRMMVTPEVAKIAAQVIETGSISVSRLGKAVRQAIKDAKVTPWAPGGLRHSFVSWKVAEGVPLEAIAAYTNHDLATLKKFYNAAAIPLPKATLT